ncbi:CCC motif membrane protein [Chryseobacterium indoltheticum]|uniref:CCC motif membrane protein n=1 Tax=Chryseobacterium indoltheticum TaxID=254 RepID=UPI003F497B9C
MNQQKLPNATAVLVLGIVSIVGCCCYGVLGLIAGIIGLVLYKKDNALYQSNPTLYSITITLIQEEFFVLLD